MDIDQVSFANGGGIVVSYKEHERVKKETKRFLEQSAEVCN